MDSNQTLETPRAPAVDRAAPGSGSAVFRPHWPKGLETRTFYEVPCDDKGRSGGCWLRVMVADDGDVHVSMQDWEDIPNGNPDPFPSVRVRTYAGGGRHQRTRQALLWLAEAIRLDCQNDSTLPPGGAKL